MGADERHGAVPFACLERGRPVTQREGEVFPVVDEPVEAEHRASVAYPSANRRGSASSGVRIVALGGLNAISPVLEARREGVPQEHDVADLPNVDERRPAAEFQGKWPSRTNLGASESPTNTGATLSCSSSTRSSVRNRVCTGRAASTISRSTPRAARSC
jgi:hypothetical protein